MIDMVHERQMEVKGSDAERSDNWERLCHPDCRHTELGNDAADYAKSAISRMYGKKWIHQIGVIKPRYGSEILSLCHAVSALE